MSAASLRARSCRATAASAAGPATASTRRTPEATAPSLATLRRPIWPVWSRCVPPQSSTEKSPIRMTATRWPYFSPKSASAPERSVEQMRPGVVLAQALAARRLHADRHVFALAEAPAAHAHAVDEKLRAAVVRVDDLATAVAPDERTDVAHLTARLGVSRGAIEDHLDLGALRHFGHTPQPIRAIDEGQDPCRRRERLVAD